MRKGLESKEADKDGTNLILGTLYPMTETLFMTHHFRAVLN